MIRAARFVVGYRRGSLLNKGVGFIMSIGLIKILGTINLVYNSLLISSGKSARQGLKR